jgi:hypothetical protein
MRLDIDWYSSTLRRTHFDEISIVVSGRVTREELVRVGVELQEYS